MKSHVTFDYFGHQPVERSPAGRQLLQHVRALGLLAESALESIDLSADFANAEEKFVTILRRMSHPHILYRSIVSGKLSLYWRFDSCEFKAPIACPPASKYDDQGVILGVHTTRRTALRLLSVLVAVAVLSFGLQAAGHWHSQSYEDQHCRVCHFAHSVTVNPSHAAALPLPDMIARLSVIPGVDPTTDTVVHQLSSRGPPSA